jgi:nuclear transcription Y subunit beta
MSSPAQSPREPEDVDQAHHTPPEENEPQPGQDGETTMSRDDAASYDFEVKEQDRWLPIANGE